MEPLELEDQFVTTEAGYQLHYQSAGTGEPLIFLHGGGPGATSFGNFYYNAPAFLEQYQCFFYNMPGYGQSSKLVVEAPMYSFHASVLAEFMDLVGIPRAHLVCQSFGGCAAIKLAIDHPERVNKLVLMGAQPMFGGVIDPLKLMSKHAANIILDYYGGEGPTPEKMRRLLADYEMHDDSKLTDWTVNDRFANSTDPELLEVARTPGFMGQPESLLGDLHRNVVPTLCLWGLLDWFGGPDVPLLFLNQFANAQLFIEGQGAHHWQTELPERFNRVVLSYLSE